jgi:excisionase family DNA binding protein
MKLRVSSARGSTETITLTAPIEITSGARGLSRVHSGDGTVHLFDSDGHYVHPNSATASELQSELPPNLLFRRKETAAILAISVSSLDQLIACGEIRVKRLGRLIMIPREQLEAALAKRDDRAKRRQRRPARNMQSLSVGESA